MAVVEQSYTGWIIVGVILFLFLVWLVILTIFEFIPNNVVVNNGGTTVVITSSGLDTYSYATGSSFAASSAGDYSIPLTDNQILTNVTVNGDGTQFFVPAGTYEYSYTLVFTESVNINAYLTGSAISSAAPSEIGDFAAPQWNHTGLFISSHGGYVSLNIHITGPVSLNTTGIGASLTLLRINAATR